jgi:sulfur carrier protein
VECTISVIGGDDHPVTLPADATYADAVAAVDCSPQAATALVDGHPVPNDAPVEAERIEVVQLIRGG